MGVTKADKLEPKSFVEENFLSLLETLKERNKQEKKFPYKDQHFCQVMNVHDSYINGLKRGRSLDGIRLVMFCKSLGLDLNQFCYDDAPFEYKTKNKSPESEPSLKNSAYATDNATVSLNSGEVHGDLHIGDKINHYYDKIVKKAPPINKKDFSDLLQDVKAIKKIADMATSKSTQLTTIVEELKGSLSESREEVDSLQKELLKVYREKKQN